MNTLTQKQTQRQAAPQGWDAAAHDFWLDEKRQEAINAVLANLNQHTAKKPLPLVLQFSYYLYLAGDPATAARVLEMVRPDYAADPQLLLNLSVCLSKSQQHDKAIEILNALSKLQPDNPVVWDGIAHAAYMLKRFEEAEKAGTRAITIKDRVSGPLPKGWTLPATNPEAYLQQKPHNNVIAFSLWGDNPCYLRGALDNALAGAKIYPGWRLRFYVDQSVPPALCDALRQLGADIITEASDQPLRQKLCWRFQVANDENVGRFLVRDVDSVINQRERLAVDAWVASDQWFHVMRDYWTHSDLILAGMWGGIAGVLPDLSALMETYKPPAMETPNIDQWFLRDKVWPYVRTSCLVHDRCFKPHGALPWPEKDPAGNAHVGQNVYAVSKAMQEARLAEWIKQLPCLS